MCADQATEILASAPGRASFINAMLSHHYQSKEWDVMSVSELMLITFIVDKRIDVTRSNALAQRTGSAYDATCRGEGETSLKPEACMESVASARRGGCNRSDTTNGSCVDTPYVRSAIGWRRGICARMTQARSKG